MQGLSPPHHARLVSVHPINASRCSRVGVLSRAAFRQAGSSAGPPGPSVREPRTGLLHKLYATENVAVHLSRRDVLHPSIHHPSNVHRALRDRECCRASIAARRPPSMCSELPLRDKERCRASIRRAQLFAAARSRRIETEGGLSYSRGGSPERGKEAVSARPCGRWGRARALRRARARERRLAVPVALRARAWSRVPRAR